MEKIKVMIIGNDDHIIYDIKDLLKNAEIAFVGFSKQDETAMEKIRSLKPSVILLQCDDGDREAIALADKIYVNVPGCSVLALCGRLEVEFIERAMLAGIRKVLQLPMEADTLTENIKSAYTIEKSRLQNRGSAAANLQSRVITVFGAKGGIGKTTIVVNLAVVLSQLGKKVAVIDADLQFGDVNVFFDIEAKDTIAELTQSKEAGDIDAIRRITVLHQSGVSILCAPKSPEYAEYVTAKNIESIITAMRPFYDYVIIDTTPQFNDITMAAVENSNLVLLVSGMDISNLRNTKTTLGILESLKQSDKVEVVVNRIAGGIITLKDIERVLGLQVKNKISFDYKTALNSHNKGIPIVLDSPRSLIASELKQLAGSVVWYIDSRI